MSNPTDVMVQRVVAFVIDGVLFGAAWIGVFFALATKTTSGSAISSAAHVRVNSGHTTWYVTGGRFWVLQAAMLAVGFAGYALVPGLTGWTLGKLLLGIRIVTPEGRRAGVDKNLVRWVLLIVDDFPYFIPGLAGFIIALTSKGHRRLGDIAAGTYVVRKDAVGQPVVIPTGPSPQAWVGMPAGPGVPATAPPALPPPGWHSDPYGQARLRWWDGTRWTGYTSP
jgi:uncharacterized RDD family membrane protein YckC